MRIDELRKFTFLKEEEIIISREEGFQCKQRRISGLGRGMLSGRKRHFMLPHGEMVTFK